jgi:hypothetical protein
VALHIRVPSVVLCNEEASHRVGARYLTAATGMTMQEVKDNPARARDCTECQGQHQDQGCTVIVTCHGWSLYASHTSLTSLSLTWVTSLPVLVASARPDEALKANAIYARQIAKHTTVLSSTCLSYLLMQRVRFY